MTIKTKSKFYYGHVVTRQNRSMPIDEGSGEINVNLRVGSYSLTDFVTEVERALNSDATLDYTVSVDRDTRIITIDISSGMEFLFSSGLTIGTSAAVLLGFAIADTGSSVQHIGTSASGSEFKPQFKLQNFDNNIKTSLANVNESANGKNIEVISFGRVGFMECNIMFQTDKTQSPKVSAIENDPSGVTNLRSFLDASTLKGDIEFMPDRDDTSTFTKVILEKTRESKDGTDYKVKEMTKMNIFDYFESGMITFRRIT